MALGDFIIALDDLDRDYRTTHKEMSDPAAFALDQLKLEEQLALLNARRSQMKMAFAKLKHALATARGNQLHHELHTFLQINGMPAAEALGSWLSADWNDLLAELPALQDAYEQLATEVERVVNSLVERFNRDSDLIERAMALSEAGEYSESQKCLARVTRLFKGIPYPVAEAAAARLPALIESHRVAFDAERHRIESKLQEWAQQPGTRYRGGEGAKLVAAIQAADQPALKAVEENAGVRPGSEFHTRLAELIAAIGGWKGETLERYEVIKAAAAKQRAVALVTGLVSATVICLLLLWYAFHTTGYRYVNPQGETIVARYRTPGTYTVEEQVPGYHKLTKTFSVSLMQLTDLGTLDKSAMQRESGRLEVDVQPENVEVWVQGEGATAKEFAQGKGTVLMEKAPTGTYKVTFQLGDFKHEEKLTVENGKTATLKKALEVGNVNVVTTPAGAQVIWKGRPMGSTPLSIPAVKPGEVALTLKFGELEVPAKTTVAAGQTAILQHDFPFGSVVIDSEPTGAEVRFLTEGIPGGKTPLQVSKVLARPYEVELTYPGLDPRSATVTVKAGENNAAVKVKFVYGKLAVTSKPAGALIMFKDQALPPGREPYRAEYVRPGTYGIIARYGPVDLRQDVTVTADKEAVATIAYPLGSARIEAEPEGVTAVVLGTGVDAAVTPAELKELPAGQYVVSLQLGNQEKRMPMLVRSGETTTLKARFLGGWVEKQNLPASDMTRFVGEGTITPARGLPSAVIGGPVDVAIKKYGKPERVSLTEDPHLGKIETATWLQAGISIVSDGITIHSVTATPGTRPRGVSSAEVEQGTGAQEVAGPWLKTSKGISLGALMDEVVAKHGPPVKRTGNALSYPGMTFLFAPRGGQYALISIRAEPGAQDQTAPPAAPAPAPATKPKGRGR
ncbi:hypothetical protein DB346_05665 [Verrucomicrobia bacterium LW23]|nr:hypothetical protein DB346_05665 [Verrucomicrobia bacterium LW23]